MSTFRVRHIGPDAAERDAMLEIIGAASLDALVAEAIPGSIRLKAPLDLPPGQSEDRYLRDLRDVASRNQQFRSYIGLGYSNCVTPAVIQRNVLENPGWYTPYTPYQAEIAQGRLEGLLTFQTMVADLTGMEIANASLLDEATAAAEAMTMLHRLQTKRVEKAPRRVVFFVARSCFPQTIDVLRARAEPLGIELAIGEPETADLGADVFGALLQTPDEAGLVHDFSGFVTRARQAGVLVAVASDLLALTLLRPPGEWGADVVVGNSQRFGVPLGYGGPHAAFFATRQAYVRQTPGRIIGASVDAHGHIAYRMALQTREQHIRREKATSNICTAEALLANLAAFYAVYHGPDGLAAIARRIRSLAAGLVRDLAEVGVTQLNDTYFDTLRLAMPDGQAAVGRVRQAALLAGINFRYRDDGTINVALDETTDERDIASIARVFGVSGVAQSSESPEYPPAVARTSAYLTHPVFTAHRSETHMMRFLKSLERKDIGLDTSMIPLGSCTMKLNAAAAMMPITWSSFSKLHPFAPVEQAAGYQQILRELESALCTITGFAAVSLQPNSGPRASSPA